MDLIIKIIALVWLLVGFSLFLGPTLLYIKTGLRPEKTSIWVDVTCVFMISFGVMLLLDPPSYRLIFCYIIAYLSMLLRVDHKEPKEEAHLTKHARPACKPDFSGENLTLIS